jgi:hypothetical protein
MGIRDLFGYALAPTEPYGWHTRCTERRDTGIEARKA